MNHSISFNVAEAHLRYEAYRSKFPQKKIPAPFQFDSTKSVSDNLNRLALFALHPDATLPILYAYKPIFLDLMARWVESPELYESGYVQQHGKTQAPQLSGSIVLLALSRVAQLFPESVSLVETYISQIALFDTMDRALAKTIDPVELQLVLLAVYRVFTGKPNKFKPYIRPQTLHQVLSLPEEYSIAKFLAVSLLCNYLEASEKARAEMIETHIEDGALTGVYDANYKIDYRFISLVEAKRLSNFTKLPPSVVCSESHTFTIGTPDLSAHIVSVCGVLVTRRSDVPLQMDSECVETENSVSVLKKLAKMIQNDRPVMLHGRAGSGKTFLINQMAKYLGCEDSIVKIHLGEQTDAKLLLGTYTSGEKPGSFQWRSGVLTTAVREGKWVLVEDIDKAPTEVLSILLTLLEKRELSIPSRGEVIKAHSGFQLISTVRTQSEASSKVPDMIGSRLWEMIEVTIPSELELRSILVTKFPLLRNLIVKFITVYNKVLHIYSLTSFISLNKGSHPRVISTRDLMKFCSRCNRMLQNRGIDSPDLLLETSVYENIFAEAVECFGSAITEHGALVPLVNAIGEILEVPSSRINLFLDSYVPNLHIDDEKIEIGRSVLKKSVADKALYVKKKTGTNTDFARTKHSKRLMEQIGMAIEMVDPVLLVGETGTGKTTVVQEIAKMMNKKLTVINVSQQTESGDLLGGYKPVNTKTVAIPLQEVFENLFLVTFSQKKNAKFSALLSKCFNKNQWKNVIKLWNEAVKMARELLSKVEDSDEDVKEEGGPKKKRKLRSSEKSVLLAKWLEFKDSIDGFETQAANLESSFVFSFVEGSLVKAVKNGEWLLLDEINLASPDTLESIADLLSENLDQRSVLLSERGDTDAVKAHPEFRIFGCMNPSTDVGKKDLPLSIRSRFTEIYVHSPDRDREDLLSIIDKYISRYSVGDDWACDDIAELYLEAKRLAEANKIVDGANQKPHFSIRTLTRTLIYVRDIVGIYGLRRALYEGFCMAFLTLLDIESEKLLKPVIEKFTIAKLKNAKHIISRCPPPPTSDTDDYVQFRHYWMKRGPGEIGSPNYIITPFVEKNLLNLVRATASRKFPVLVQGPTSAGKTSMISYLASITGHKFVRINNHEHTDLQEYLGTYVSDSSGKLVFREGVLVEALRKGHWIVLDELNLAPTDVLEALNRLLDDNRELFIPETQEVVHPHPDFMLFATQNPPGLYGGRKVLSRAFRNRFLELHFDDIPQDELEIILKERCQIAPSYSKKIVEVYKQLSVRRQSSRLFEQKNSFATLRDLFRWALREAVGYEELAANGYMLLAERVRNDEEKVVVKEAIEKVMRVKLDMDSYYEKLENKELIELELSIVWTKAMRRLAVLVETSIKNKEPLLLVGETGCGKTTVCQVLAQLLGRQLITVNAHQNTETGDILGAQRPLRNRFEIRAELLKNLVAFFTAANLEITLEKANVEDLVKKYQQTKKAVLEDPNNDINDESIAQIDENIKNSSVLFEWMDGPLIQAMKTGDFFLLDEISLADDSVLERLNSVLEPERSLLLAEKGTEDAFLTAAESFQFLATMNPGGDYGKKELSPALRNRFTEIWVPSMDDFNDVKQIVSSRLKPDFASLCDPLVDFSQWFGKKLGNGNANSGVISLRDILAWVEFVNSCENIAPEAALLHGASMVFIDALGTNNTAYLAENEEKLSEYKKECINKLSSFFGADLSKYLDTTETQVEVASDKLKAGIFEIERLPKAEWSDSFNLHAPTTSANAMRVVRAMQVHKPILLEGSPGVGKTSLISAVAKATGNTLIRINLSEQTDLIDLFGSDAPVEGGQTGEFVWRDAPFLRAMKNGEWVLLDEMNLASQSVLEGLNACLDHRGEAYIPELDRSFPRHPDFKVFAAQNPQYQGGGRKGLPKSFVNRFTVVYVDTLKAEDLVMIAHQYFPKIPLEDCSKMISFMSRLEEEVVIKKSWGTSGGPWEFNLRDTLRWLSLYNSKHNLSGDDLSFGDFLNMIVCQRFRSPEDRAHVIDIFNSAFGEQTPKNPFFALGPDYIQAGGAIIKRRETINSSNSADRVNFVPLQSNFPILESAIRSVNENIPLILTGPTNSGKTELVRFLANSVGVRLSEFAMNSDVDSMDILGGYEQVDLTRAITEITSTVYAILDELIIINLQVPDAEPLLLSRSLSLLQYLESNVVASDTFDEFVSHFKGFLSLYSNETLAQLLDRALDLEKRLKEVTSVKFEWFDGLLVQAVTRGDWLVLDNANLCNASVLDRLNSLLETNGTLIINECSAPDGSPRVLVPHPNFRLFLTVDPKYGELSRAMRNRCIEVYMESLDQRCSTFDKRCLGIEVAKNAEEKADSDITTQMENLQVSESSSVAKPLTAFVSCTESSIRSLVALHDVILEADENVLSSALVGLLTMSQLGTFDGWISSAYGIDEFSLAEKNLLEEVNEIISGLNQSGFISKIEEMYTSGETEMNASFKFTENQYLHPLLNRHIMKLLTHFAPFINTGEPTMALQVASSLIMSRISLTKLETRAIHAKMNELSFVELSAAYNLGRDIKKAPKINIHGFMKSLYTFITKVFNESLNEFFKVDLPIYTWLLDLLIIWKALLEASAQQNISKLRVYHSMVTHWIESHGEETLIKPFIEDVSALNIGLQLTSGFSMAKIWEKFRQVYPSSEAAWDNYASLLALLNDFDALTKRLYPETNPEVTSLRTMIIDLHDTIISNDSNKEILSDLFESLNLAIKKLAELAQTFNVMRNNEFQKEFTLLTNFVEVSGYFSASTYDKQLFLANYSGRSTLALVYGSKQNIYAPYPRIFDSLWSSSPETGIVSLVSGLFTNDLLVDALNKSIKLDSSPGNFLDQNLADLKTLGGELVENSCSVLENQQQKFEKILVNWTLEVSKAHGFTIPEEFSVSEEKIAELAQIINEQAEDAIRNIFEEYILSSLYLVSKSTGLAQLGKAWVLFSAGLIQLFVPNSPLDPAIDEYVAYDVLEMQKKMSSELIYSWKSVRTVISGDSPLILEKDIPDHSEASLEKPRVFRKDESVDTLFEEWNAFMESAIDVGPIKQLLAAAENIISERNSQIVGVFQNNSSNFMLRLGTKFFVYADLNEILNGYIYGLRLGIEMMSIEAQNNAAMFDVSPMWPLNITNLLDPSSVENTFATIKKMNKTFDTGSVLSERLMLFFINLCFAQKNNLDDTSMDSILNQAFQSVYYRWYYRRMKEEEQAAQDGSLYKHKDTDDAEEDFRELFPDYDEVLELGEGKSKKTDDFEDVYEQLVALYIDHYFEGASTTFKSTMLLGAKICSSMQQLDMVRDTNNPSYLCNLLLNMDNSRNAFSIQPEQDVSFYHEANPAEYGRAMSTMLSVNNAVAGLLAQWPEHATLQNIARTTHEFMACPSNMPLAQLLHKVEIIFNYLNEWEKFASSQVTLKFHYDELIKLIVSWRKLELSSWKALFHFEDLRCRKNLGKWWFHLFESIVIPFSQDNELAEKPSVVQILGALNIFMSETTFGEFELRLKLVKAFANHMSSLNLGDGALFNALSNFSIFYEQFLPRIEESMHETKKKLEKDVNEVILLASWKDVNVDALKQSSQRSHNNLYKVVRKYRALLNTPVAPIIQSGVTENTRVAPVSKEIRPVHFLDRSNAEKLDILKSCGQLLTWNERPNRLKNMDTIENNMKIYIDKITSAETPSLYDYAKVVVEEMENLRKETPSVLNDDTKKTVAALKTQKHKLLSDTLKELRRIGIKTSVKPDVKKILATVNLILVNGETFAKTPLQGIDPHFFRILDILPQLRGSISSGNEDIPQPDLERGLAASENLMFSLVTTRRPLVAMSSSVEELGSLCECFKTIAENEKFDLQRASVVSSIELNLDQMKQMGFYLAKLLEYSIEVTSSVSSLYKEVNNDLFTSAKTSCELIMSRLPLKNTLVFTSVEVTIVNDFRSFLDKFIEDLHSWSINYPQFAFISNVVLTWILKWQYKPFVNSSTSVESLSVIENVETSLRKASNSILITIQNILELFKEEITDETDDWVALSQQRLSKCMKQLRLRQIIALFQQAKQHIFQIEQNEETSRLSSALISFTMPLLIQYQNLAIKILSQAKNTYTEMTKSTFILTKSLLTLANDGFCSPEPPSEQKQDNNLHDGTGLGDGEGVENNSKDVEEDDDLTEHAQQPNDEQNKDENEDENDDAVDMEGDMAGDLENLSDQEKDDEDENGEEDKEDLDEEVDDLDDLDPNAVDEKMWDEEAKEDEKEKESDKMPQNSVQDDDNMEANEDEEQSKENDQSETKDDEKDNKDEQDADEESGEEDVGEQEDEVKNEENEQLDDHVPETETLDLPDDLNLDDDEDEKEDGEEEENEQFEDNMEVDEEEDSLKQDKQDDDQEPEEQEAEANKEETDEAAEEDENAEEEEDENNDNDVEGDADANEEPGIDSDEEVGEADKKEEENEENPEEDNAENGEEAAEGVDGAENEQDEDVDMDATTKTEAGEKGDGADNQVIEEQDDMGATGGASSDLKQEEEQAEQPTNDDGARDEMKESLKQLGDSLKEFHRRRQEIKESSEETKEETEEKADVRPDEFQHVDGDNSKHDTQALGAADNKDQVQSIDDEMAIDDDEEEPPQELNEDVKLEGDDKMEVDENAEEVPEKAENEADDFDAKTKGAVVGERRAIKEEEEDSLTANAEFDDTEAEKELELYKEEEYVLGTDDIPAMTMDEARVLWKHSDISTQELAAGLCEQLRLILEPTLATKLRGDYKTGKRLNMKRIISYIASDFRKDKIWLRRTKPSKRQYQIMIAVDDSKSMSESNATELAFHSIALVSKALTQLESGGLSIVRFGEDVKLVHPFDKPFSQESGANAFQWFDFKQERTDIKLLCTKSLKIFENARLSTSADLWQLQIIISDGVCEDHQTVQRLVRRAREEKVMLVFVVIDGITSNESILDMSQVSYSPDPITGAMTLKVENYLDTFPFEFYVVVRNINELPEMLSLILRQYFSEVSNM